MSRATGAGADAHLTVTPGVRVDTAVDDLRLVGIAFDSKTLRIITEANGRASVIVTELPR